MDKLDLFLSCAILMLNSHKKKFPDSRLMRVETFNLIQETLEKYTGKAALLLMNRLGELYADSLLDDKKFKNKGLNQLIDASIKAGSQNKWFYLSKKNLNKNEIILSFDYTFESIMHKKSDYSVCGFLEGFFKKVSNNSKEKTICLCEQTKCLAKGDDCCEFKIKKIG